MQINCLLPAPRAEEKRVVRKADQHSTSFQSCRTSDKCQHACISPPQPSQKKLRCMPTLWCTTDVCGGPCVDSALGVLGQGILPGPVKVVHLVLHEAADLLIFKAAGVICREGKGRDWSAAVFQTFSTGCLGTCSKSHGTAMSPLRWSSWSHQAGDRRAASDLRRRHENIHD